MTTLRDRKIFQPNEKYDPLNSSPILKCSFNIIFFPTSSCTLTNYKFQNFQKSLFYTSINDQSLYCWENLETIFKARDISDAFQSNQNNIHLKFCI